MTILAASWKDGASSRIHKLKLTGTVWADVTGNLPTLLGGNFYATALHNDMLLWESSPSGLPAGAGALWGCSRLSADNTWVELWRSDPDADDAIEFIGGFVEWDGGLYVYGNKVGGAYQIWRVVADILVDVALSTTLNVGSSFQRCVLPNPTVSTELILTDNNTDEFATYSTVSGFHSRGGDPGGSCVYSVGVDNAGVTWAGSFDSKYWYTTDGHTWVLNEEAAGGTEEGVQGPLSGIYPELWDQVVWKGQLYGVGCAPTGIVRRTTTTDPGLGLTAIWEVVHRKGAEGVGVGFQAALPDGDRLLLGYGGEPNYNSAAGTPGRVFAWDGLSLTDISGGHDFGDGVYILGNVTEAFSVPALTGSTRAGRRTFDL